MSRTVTSSLSAMTSHGAVVRLVNLRAFVVAAVAATALMGIGADSASALSTRTWVSGVGDDFNPCSRTAPCKTFAQAIVMTQAGGTISVLDPGGYGAVTITKSITIDGTGTIASALVSGTNGITINADSSVVTLKNIQIESVSGTGIGVEVFSARSVLVENSTIHGFSTGVFVSNVANEPRITLHNSTITNVVNGVRVSPTPPAKATLLLDSSLISLATNGMVALDDGKVVASRSTFSDLTNGFYEETFGHFSQPVPNAFVDNNHVSFFNVLPAPAGTVQFVGKARAGVRLKFSSTVAGTATVAIKKTGRTVASFRAAIKASNTNSILWNGKSGKAYAAKGVYDAIVTFKSKDGQDQSFTGTVKLI